MFSQIHLLEFNTTQLILVALIFTWSGFVRSGLGFGGAALGLPLMLFIDDQPLFWLPVIGTHLLIFTGWTLRSRLKNVDWGYLKKSFVYILPAKLVGVFGLLNLPNNWLIIMIYSITMFYAVLWLLNLKIHSEKGWTDKILLVLGGYVSGTSLTGAPLIVAVFMQKINKSQLRDTLFVLWFILVTVKMSTFVAFGVDLHTGSALLLVPAAAVGHIIGLKTHDYMMHNDALFKRVIGAVLMIICLIGFSSLL
ncbi:MAG: TSUP family transporter [Gammaproteobacteria bacterium]|nr:TSUP family transporter [Gammaproteobacteria bacterium]MBL6998557.1 TSUP family transporter [Gammaproteobacteria bacterium]